MAAYASHLAETSTSEPQPYDAEDIRALFVQYAPFVGRTLRYLGVREADLDDVCQDVFVVAMKRASTFEGRAAIRTWLYQICINLSRAYRRRAHRRHERPMDPMPDSSVAAAQHRKIECEEARTQVWQALDALDDKKREVFVLFEIEQLPMQEVAEQLDVPLQTAYARLYAAREEFTKAVKRLSSQRGGRP